MSAGIRLRLRRAALLLTITACLAWAATGTAHAAEDTPPRPAPSPSEPGVGTALSCAGWRASAQRLAAAVAVSTDPRAAAIRASLAGLGITASSGGCSPPPAGNTGGGSGLGAGATVPVGSKLLFTGDYSTGDLSQWGTCQSVDANSACGATARIGGSVEVVPDGPRPGVPAAKFTVGDGDVPEFGGGERSEVQSDDPGALTHEGDERFYQWSMMLPTDFPTPTGGWFIVMQWHAGSGSPPLAITISSDDTVDIGGDGVDHPHLTLGPVRRGQWVDYTLHVKFSRNASTGFVEGWENGIQTVPKTNRATMSSEENYLKQGIYRDADDSGTSVVWLTGLKVSAP